MSTDNAWKPANIKSISVQKRGKMKRKKMMAAVLAALMTCSAFTPAVAVKADDDVVKLKIWVFGEGSTEECEKYLRLLAKSPERKLEQK